MKVTRNGLVIIVFVSVGQREHALSLKQMGTRDVNCFALEKRVPLKGVITGVVVNVKVDQLKGKIPVMLVVWCNTDSGVSGETEESLSVFLFVLILSLCPTKLC